MSDKLSDEMKDSYTAAAVYADEVAALEAERAALQAAMGRK